MVSGTHRTPPPHTPVTPYGLLPWAILQDGRCRATPQGRMAGDGPDPAAMFHADRRGGAGRPTTTPRQGAGRDCGQGQQSQLVVARSFERPQWVALQRPFLSGYGPTASHLPQRHRHFDAIDRPLRPPPAIPLLSCHHAITITHRTTHGPCRVRTTPAHRRCLKCHKRIPVKRLGGIPMYCSASCRQHVFRKRKQQAKPPPVSSEDQQRLLLWQMLVDLKVIAADTPMPPKRKAEDAS